MILSGKSQQFDRYSHFSHRLSKLMAHTAVHPFWISHVVLALGFD
jgi:hypothetical protein